MPLPTLATQEAQILTPKQVQDYIVEQSLQKGVNPNLALSIAFAESGFHCTVKNKNSSAGGVYQFIDSTWISTRKRMSMNTDLALKYNCKENIDSAIFLLSMGEISHWNASKHNWQ